MGRKKIFHSLNLHFPGFQKGYESLQMLIGYLSFLSLCNDSSYPLYIYWVICLFYITLLKLLTCFDCWSHLCICFKNFHSHYFQLELWYLWLYSSFSLYMVKSVNICHYVFWVLYIVGKILLRYTLGVHFVWALWKGNLAVFLFHTENSFLWNMLFPLSSFEYFARKKLYTKCKFIFLGYLSDS